jgi:hypothetical protein
MSAGERIRREVREIGLVTLYFLACFLLFLSLKKLLLEEYDVETRVLHTAVIGALVVAKVVVVLDKTAFGNWFRTGRLATHVFWRSLAYTAVVFVVSLAERLLDLYRETGQLAAAIADLWAGRDVRHFLAMNLCVGLSFLAYSTFSEIDRRLGEGGLRRAFFAKESG